MKHFIITYLLSIASLFVYSQGSNLANDYLVDLFGGFPLALESDSLKGDYLEIEDYESVKNIYDPSITDYKKAIKAKLPLEIQPNSAYIEYFYAYGWGGASEHSQVTSLTLTYGNDSNPCKKQAKLLVKDLRKLTAKTEKAKTYADAGHIGEIYKFYKAKNDIYPFLTVDVTDKDCTSEICHIFIAYIRELEMKNSP